MDKSFNESDTKSSDQEPQTETAKRLFRTPQNGVIAGVCAGIASYLAVDVVAVRVLLIFLTFITGGLGVIAYIILAIVMPVGNNVAATGDLNDAFNSLAEEVKGNDQALQARNIIGVIFIIIGAWTFLAQIFPSWLRPSWDSIWPVALIVIGGIIIFRRQ